MGLASTKALDTMQEYYRYLSKHTYYSVATICDPRFNFYVFEKVLPDSADLHVDVRSKHRSCCDKIKRDYITTFLRYQAKAQAIAAVRSQQDFPELPNELVESAEEKSDDEL
jgi:hypothetical protein